MKIDPEKCFANKGIYNKFLKYVNEKRIAVLSTSVPNSFIISVDYPRNNQQRPSNSRKTNNREKRRKNGTKACTPRIPNMEKGNCPGRVFTRCSAQMS